MVKLTRTHNKHVNIFVATLPCEEGTISARKDYKTGQVSFMINDGYSVRYCDYRDYKALKQSLMDAITSAEFAKGYI